METRKKYGKLENILQNISKDLVAINDDAKRKNSERLDMVLQTLIRKMKSQDPLFDQMFRDIFYGGSYYDGLRVREPSEFDCDLLFNLPRLAEPKLEVCSDPGFVKVHMKSWKSFKKNTSQYKPYEKFENFLDENEYIKNDCIKSWMESNVTKALNNIDFSPLEVTQSKSGPAITLKIKGIMDIDLVPCFIFNEDQWPIGFRGNEGFTKKTFFVVPKPPPKNDQNAKIEWRFSFQEQEREILKKKEKLKPTIRLLKLLRDTQNHVAIKSYYIKTLGLWQTQKQDDSFWKNSLGYVFITMLEEYIQCLKKKEIPYYWNADLNLIKGVSVENFCNRLQRFHKKIEANLESDNLKSIIFEYFGLKENSIDFLNESIEHLQNQESSCFIL